MDWISLQQKLDKHYAWPTLYTFKFIVPKDKEIEVTTLFPNHIATKRVSKNGNYTSITFQMMMPSSEAVVAVYVSTSVVEGIIAL